MDFDKTIQGIINQYLKTEGKTKKWLANETDIKYSIIFNILSGKKHILLIEYFKICKALKISNTFFLKQKKYKENIGA
ncbi:MAG: hypothetical protein LBF97_03340 [Elusimicrobiota bacterium]|jgi:antitoxin component HigA of HigAB toxin-antitoxin module|nr:hypothetical protein [Elusimicrobiota bacterium]